MGLRNTFSIAAIMIAIAATTAAQAPAPQERIAALKESLAANQAALKQYSWVETTVISLKGEVKKQQQKQCFYGADGKVQKTPIGEPDAKPQAQEGGRRGRVKNAIVAKKVGEVKDYMEDVAALVHQYVPPDPQKIQAVQSAGGLTVQPAAGVTVLNLKDYLKPGDLLAIGFDAAAKAMKTYTVSSYVEKPKEDAVELAVTFGKLADGTSYPQQILLDAAAKKIQVKVTNSGYRKPGG
jgi:hypothetical protein